MSQLDAYEVDGTFGCFAWHGKTGSNGRPVIWRGRTPVSAYKLAYEEANGPVAAGLELDHLCRNDKQCIRPSHLEPVTREENERRKSHRYRLRTMTRCPRGHELKLHGVVTPWGGRVCRVCNKEMER